MSKLNDIDLVCDMSAALDQREAELTALRTVVAKLAEALAKTIDVYDALTAASPRKHLAPITFGQNIVDGWRESLAAYEQLVKPEQP